MNGHSSTGSAGTLQERTPETGQAGPFGELDAARAEAFGERMVTVLNDAALALMISVGHRTRLFDAMLDMPPASSHQIATAAKLEERYVREWLGAMVTGGIVEYDADRGVYWLPAEHAACLTRAAMPENLAATAQWIAVLAGVESRIVECFERGGGVPYGEYERFHEVMAEESEQTTVSALVETILPSVPGLPEALERGIQVLDVGCGRGQALLRMAEEYPRSHFTGYDLSPEAIATARREAFRRRLANVEFEVRDVTDLVDDEPAFDLITAFDAIHDQARPDRVLAGIRKRLRLGGVFLMQDIDGHSHVGDNRDHLLGPFLYTISCMHCMSVSLSQGGMGLGAMWGREKALEMLGEAGFEDVEVRNLEHDVQNTYYRARVS